MFNAYAIIHVEVTYCFKTVKCFLRLSNKLLITHTRTCDLDQHCKNSFLQRKTKVFTCVRLVANDNHCVALATSKPTTQAQKHTESSGGIHMAGRNATSLVYWVPSCIGWLRRDGQCCGRKEQRSRRSKINWTKTAHCTHGLVLI